MLARCKLHVSSRTRKSRLSTLIRCKHVLPLDCCSSGLTVEANGGSTLCLPMMHEDAALKPDHCMMKPMSCQLQDGTHLNAHMTQHWSLHSFSHHDTALTAHLPEPLHSFELTAPIFSGSNSSDCSGPESPVSGGPPMSGQVFLRRPPAHLCAITATTRLSRLARQPSLASSFAARAFLHKV